MNRRDFLFASAATVFSAVAEAAASKEKTKRQTLHLLCLVGDKEPLHEMHTLKMKNGDQIIWAPWHGAISPGWELYWVKVAVNSKDFQAEAKKTDADGSFYRIGSSRCTRRVWTPENLGVPIPMPREQELRRELPKILDQLPGGKVYIAAAGLQLDSRPRERVLRCSACGRRHEVVPALFEVTEGDVNLKKFRLIYCYEVQKWTRQPVQTK